MAAYTDESEVTEENMNYYIRPHQENLKIFFNYHPQQTTSNPLVQKVFCCKDGTNRGWLTYCQERHALHCSVCIAFAKLYDRSPFITGMTDWKHVHQRIVEHEKSMAHKTCAEAYFLNASKCDVKHLLSGSQLSSHREQMRKRRQILERVVDVVKLIGKRGLSYRSGNEAAYMLDDSNIDHGNFLEMILLLSKYDVCLKEHLKECTEKSKKLHQTGATGRGSLVTLLSKRTINSVIDTIQHLIQETIVRDIKNAVMFSVQIDTTQDITSQDQCSIVLRYVTDTIHERLISIVKCKESTGQHFVDIVAELADKINLDLSKCIGHATDGASNMQGRYKGFSAHMSKFSPNQVHVWCYAHVLNLVLADTTQTVIQCGSLFTVLNDIAVFFRESYKRMNVWESKSQDKHQRRLSLIGETRWWAKDNALRKVFGSFGNPDNCLYVDVILALTAIQEDITIKTTARIQARGFVEALIKYEMILTAQTFLRIFEKTSPLSKYLQTQGMDILSAHRMVVATHESLKKMSRDFASVSAAAKKFVLWANEKLQEQDKEIELEVQSTLPSQRKRKKKTMPGEIAHAETITSPEKAYEVTVHNQIMDTATETLHRRFLSHGTLYADLAFLDPRNFTQLKSSSISPLMFQELSKCLSKFDSEASAENLQCELSSFALQWERLKMSPLDEYKVKTLENESEDEQVEVQCKKCSSCKECPLCCYQILRRFNIMSNAYHLLGLAYQFLLTLSITQVACERTFSTLKFIKTRLRSKLSQEHLEAFMLMSTEKDILCSLDSDVIIDKVAEKSELFSKLLL